MPTVKKGCRLPKSSEGSLKLSTDSSWSKLLARTFKFDLAHCPKCGGPTEIAAAIIETDGIKRYLTHIGLNADPPVREPARPPRELFTDDFT